MLCETGDRTMRNPLALATLAAGVVTVFVVIGCSDGDERVVDPALEDYFQKTAAISQAGLDCLDALSEGNVNPDTASDETKLNSLEAVLSGSASCVEVQFDELQALDPPPDVLDEHKDFVEVVAEFVAFTQEVAEIAINADSIAAVDEVNAHFDEEEGPGGLSFRARDACLELQAIADENDIDEDLHCEA